MKGISDKTIKNNDVSRIPPDLLRLFRKWGISNEKIKMIEKHRIFTPENVNNIKKYGLLGLKIVLLALGVNLIV